MIDITRFLNLNDAESRIMEAIPVLMSDAKSIAIALCLEFPNDEYITIKYSDSDDESSEKTLTIKNDIEEIYELLLARYIVKMNFEPEKDSNNNYTHLGEMAFKAEKIIDYSFMIEESYND